MVWSEPPECIRYIAIYILSCRVHSIYCDIFYPAERLRYMTCRLTSDMSTKEFHHKCRRVRWLCCNFLQMANVKDHPCGTGTRELDWLPFGSDTASGHIWLGYKPFQFKQKYQELRTSQYLAGFSSCLLQRRERVSLCLVSIWLRITPYI